MSAQCKIIEEPALVTTRLDELDLRAEWLRTSVERGVREVLSCTENDPHQLPGILGWGRITRALRDVLIPLKGYKCGNRNGQASTIRPDRAFAIVVAGGDERTGQPGLPDPTTRSTKGLATEQAIDNNTLSLWWDRPEAEWRRFDRPKPDRPPTQTWLLLYFIDKEAEAVRLELSLPECMNDEDHVGSWTERILLDPIELAINPEVVVESDDEADDDVSVTRKSG